MPLTTQERFEVFANGMRLGRCPGSVSKPDWDAAIIAADDWIDANEASFVASLPLTYRNNSTANEKRALFMMLVAKRMGKDV
jgi:hypothetical protein